MDSEVAPEPSISEVRPPGRWQRLEAGWQTIVQRALRDQEGALLGLSLIFGVSAGFAVTVLRRGVAWFEAVAYGIPLSGDLSDGAEIAWFRVLAVPIIGGAIVGFVAWAIRRRRPHDIVDAIEANAMFGGRMSLIDSVNLALTTLLSGGFGASVGLEAAYTQLGAGLASKGGTLLRLRRDDLRTLVGCGAGAAIAAAFNAPLTGAFYAFELIIGSYTMMTLAPVTIAALAGTFTARLTFGVEPVFVVERAVQLNTLDYVLFVVLGILCAGLAIVTMRGVTATEQWFQARSTPRWARPAIGGLALGLMALIFPQTLGSGHGGIVVALHMGYAAPYLVGLVAAKIAASAISIGSGFRGGLFSSSLFLGALVGGTAAALVQRLLPGYPIDALAFALVGMGAVAAGVVGAPITMILLVLEGTGDFSATIGVMCGVITTSIVVRHWFGYSFATWRFHLRGLKITSAEDIGWLDELVVARLMRRDATMVQGNMTVSAVRAGFPLGSVKRLFILGGDRLLGLLDLAELHSPDLGGPADTLTVAELVRDPPRFLLPGQEIHTALEQFSETQLEALPVVDSAETLHVIGYVTEAYALRRYNQELERRRGEQAGDSQLYASSVRSRT